MSITTITMPVINTGHLDKDTAERLAKLGDQNEGCPCLRWSYGLILYLDDVHEEGPKCLNDIADWLQNHHFHDCWVRLDRDADLVDDLPHYDW